MLVSKCFTGPESFSKWLSGHTEASSFLFFANDISAQVSEIIMERISAEKDLVVKE